jgi:hypothetical protein
MKNRRNNNETCRDKDDDYELMISKNEDGQSSIEITDVETNIRYLKKAMSKASECDA